MDVEKKGLVHPAFVDILKKLTPDEAKIIQYFKGRDFIEYLDLRAYIKEEEGGGFRTIADHKTLLSDEVNFFMPDNELDLSTYRRMKIKCPRPKPYRLAP